MFKKLSDLVARIRGTTADNTAAYDLKREQLAALATLRTYEEWHAFLTLCDSVAAYRAEAMLYEHDPIKNAFLRGQIAALRELPLMTERLALQHINARERAIDTTASERSAAKRASSLYATPNWGGHA